MTERKWTPGPWAARNVEHGAEWMGIAVVDADGREIFWAENDPDTDMPNARLIAAAPDMYEALEAMLNSVDDVSRGRAFDALAKARGEA